MAGIVAYGAYVPRYRLNRKTISQAIGWLSPAAMPGEKAVANYDEDSLTMGVAAALECLKGLEREKVDPERFSKLIDRFYEINGWNKDGIPASETLAELDLGFVSDDFQQRGIA